MRIYAGTSLTTDTFLENKYQQSSQGIWVIKCDNGHWNVPLPELHAMDMIQAQGPSCYKCHRLLNVAAGHFEHMDRNALEAKQVGFHIPQIVVPNVVYKRRRWAKIYEMKMRMGADKKFWQEIMGIPSEEGEREITKKNLMDLCTIPSLRQVRDRARNRGYKFVVSGCDWGGSDHNPAKHTKVSTTVHAMMGIRPDGTFDIIHFMRYSGMNYETILDHIILHHTMFNGSAIASDYGVGQYYRGRSEDF